jgi:hypothetical protein
MRYSQYMGKGGVAPRGIWPVGSGTMAETSFRIPVYRGWPEKPYKVLGSIRFEDPRKYWDNGVISMAASMGKNQGGDAIVIRQGSEFGVGKYTGFSNPSRAVFQFAETTALVVRWLTPEEIRHEEALNKEFMRKFNARFPNLNPNMDVRETALRFLLQIDAGDFSDESLPKFAELLRRVSLDHGASLSGEWLFKGSVSVSGLSFSDEESILGIATVKVEGESIAVVSSKGIWEMSFSGTVNRGRLSGTLGIAGLTAKCEGAALDDKMSLSFQSLTPDGTMRGNLVFQRSIK